uniref:Secreted protein n=1 Tax=Setaria viridis TaxID=4556 RepID=A0A4U6TRI4_SETVI|nr:hypothetical protein SEVIR_7G185150v2 [Setaria viridis]
MFFFSCFAPYKLLLWSTAAYFCKKQGLPALFQQKGTDQTKGHALSVFEACPPNTLSMTAGTLLNSTCTAAYT